ncbi:hypothetical protein WISP_78094 [Willisornis vidua]|uniref:Uncharacterized protein n=1 Tax=Willisornis vidua TaxID=1566151 RepID=A0ABQ9DA18_9PASS|nr:hypothetical protein WISP_78094 [Willisornis vidua]
MDPSSKCSVVAPGISNIALCIPVCRGTRDLTFSLCSESRMDGSTRNDTGINDMSAIKAFPVFYDANRAPTWEPLSVPLLKEAKKAIIDYGLGLAFTMGVLNSLFQAFIFTPNDIKDLARTLLNNMQITMFLDYWLANIRKYAHETVGYTGRPVPITIDMLFGMSHYAYNALQHQNPPQDLITTKTLAFPVLQTITEAS